MFVNFINGRLINELLNSHKHNIVDAHELPKVLTFVTVVHWAPIFLSIPTYRN